MRGLTPPRALVLKAMESINNFDTGGIRVSYSPTNRIGSRYVEVTVVGCTGKLIK